MYSTDTTQHIPTKVNYASQRPKKSLRLPMVILWAFMKIYTTNNQDNKHKKKTVGGFYPLFRIILIIETSTPINI